MIKERMIELVSMLLIEAYYPDQIPRHHNNWCDRLQVLLKEFLETYA